MRVGVSGVCADTITKAMALIQGNRGEAMRYTWAMDMDFDKRAYVRACRHLPFRLELERLQHEVAGLPAGVWGDNRAPVHRETVSVFLKGHPPLLNLPDDPDQPVLEQCPYIRQLLYQLLPGTPGKCLLAALKPRGIVYPHIDAANDYFIRSFRIHIPVFTNEAVWFYCDGRLFRMLAGEVWAVNNLVPHAVINDHSSDVRIHLIFDIFPSEAAVQIVSHAAEAPGELDPVLLRRLASRSSFRQGQANQNL